MRRRAIFLDRDGTVVRAIYRPTWEKKITAPFYINEVTFEPHLGEALKIFRSFGYMIIMATNQPDVAHGYVTEKRWQEIHDAILAEVKPDFCLMCRHLDKYHCPNKKPQSGMLKSAADFFNLDDCLRGSFMIGDTRNDMLAGKKTDCKTILIQRPYNIDDGMASIHADYIVKSLLEAAAIV